MPNLGQLPTDKCQGHNTGIAATLRSKGGNDTSCLPHRHAGSLDAQGRIGSVITGNGPPGNKHIAYPFRKHGT